MIKYLLAFQRHQVLDHKLERRFSGGLG